MTISSLSKKKSLSDNRGSVLNLDGDFDIFFTPVAFSLTNPFFEDQLAVSSKAYPIPGFLQNIILALGALHQSCFFTGALFSGRRTLSVYRR